MDIEYAAGRSFVGIRSGIHVEEKNNKICLWAVTSCDCCSHYAGAIFGAPLLLAALSRCLAVGASRASISFPYLKPSSV